MTSKDLGLTKAMLNSLKHNTVDLKTHLTALDGIFDYLVQNDVGIDTERIMETSPVRKDRVGHLLSSLRSRPATEYWIFLKSLYSEAVHQGHLAEKILCTLTAQEGEITDPDVRNMRSDFLDQQHSEPAGRASANQHLHQEPPPPAPPPRVDHILMDSGMGPPVQLSEGGSVVMFDETTDGVNSAEVADGAQGGSEQQTYSTEQSTQLRNAYHEKCAEEEDSVYKMDSQDRGMALIIDNREFDHFNHRHDSIHDCEKLTILFQLKLGFSVQTKLNLTGQDMLQELHRFSSHVNEMSSTIDCCMVAIMTHGNEDILFGIDGKIDNDQPQRETFITVEHLREVFNGRHCIGMQEKPKMMIIQACRGELEDTPAGPRRYQCDVQVVPPLCMPRIPKTPNLAHFVFLFATVKGYVAYRNVFIQVLVDVFENHAHSKHVSDLRTRIARKMSSFVVNSSLFTICEERTTLDKSWYLNPPD